MTTAAERSLGVHRVLAPAGVLGRSEDAGAAPVDVGSPATGL